MDGSSVIALNRDGVDAIGVLGSNIVLPLFQLSFHSPLLMIADRSDAMRSITRVDTADLRCLSASVQSMLGVASALSMAASIPSSPGAEFLV